MHITLWHSAPASASGIDFPSDDLSRFAHRDLAPVIILGATSRTDVRILEPVDEQIEQDRQHDRGKQGDEQAAG